MKTGFRISDVETTKTGFRSKTNNWIGIFSLVFNSLLLSLYIIINILKKKNIKQEKRKRENIIKNLEL